MCVCVCTSVCVCLYISCVRAYCRRVQRGLNPKHSNLNPCEQALWTCPTRLRRWQYPSASSVLMCAPRSSCPAFRSRCVCVCMCVCERESVCVCVCVCVCRRCIVLLFACMCIHVARVCLHISACMHTICMNVYAHLCAIRTRSHDGKHTIFCKYSPLSSYMTYLTSGRMACED